MKTLVAPFLIFLLGSTAFANNVAVEKVAANIKMNDVRTVIKEVENTDNNPCMPKGKSYEVELQVKQVKYFSFDERRVIYEWETVKTVGVDKDGTVREICTD